MMRSGMRFPVRAEGRRQSLSVRRRPMIARRPDRFNVFVGTKADVLTSEAFSEFIRIKGMIYAGYVPPRWFSMSETDQPKASAIPSNAVLI